MFELIKDTNASGLIDPNLVVDMIEKRAWLPLGALAVALMVRLLKTDIRIFPDIPPRLRIWAAFFFGQVAGALEAVIAGKTYREAVLWGLVQSTIAILGQNALIESLRGGKEISIPGLTKPGVAPSPGKPPSIAPPATPMAKPVIEVAEATESDQNK